MHRWVPAPFHVADSNDHRSITSAVGGFANTVDGVALSMEANGLIVNGVVELRSQVATGSDGTPTPFVTELGRQLRAKTLLIRNQKAIALWQLKDKRRFLSDSYFQY